jgi:hypothetical protein
MCYWRSLQDPNLCIPYLHTGSEMTQTQLSLSLSLSLSLCLCVCVSVFLSVSQRMSEKLVVGLLAETVMHLMVPI